MQDRLKKDDILRVRRVDADDWCIATVAMLSDNGKSVALNLTGAVTTREGMILGVLPLTLDYDAGTATGLTGDTYTIEVGEFILPALRD